MAPSLLSLGGGGGGGGVMDDGDDDRNCDAWPLFSSSSSSTYCSCCTSCFCPVFLIFVSTSLSFPPPPPPCNHLPSSSSSSSLFPYVSTLHRSPSEVAALSLTPSCLSALPPRALLIIYYLYFFLSPFSPHVLFTSLFFRPLFFF